MGDTKIRDKSNIRKWTEIIDPEIPGCDPAKRTNLDDMDLEAEEMETRAGAEVCEMQTRDKSRKVQGGDQDSGRRDRTVRCLS